MVVFFFNHSNPRIRRKLLCLTVTGWARPDFAPSPSPRPSGERAGMRGFESETIAPPPQEPRNADIPVCGFAGHSCPVLLVERPGLATGKSPKPADKNVC